jgi:hypothetical protein
MSGSFLEHFAPLQDPRVERNQRHALLDIVLLVVCAVASGADGWEGIEEFGREKLAWLRKFAPFANGVPSHDCIANVVSRLTPNGFGECFRRWTQAVAEASGGQVIALDGKSARGWFRGGHLSASYSVRPGRGGSETTARTSISRRARGHRISRAILEAGL